VGWAARANAKRKAESGPAPNPYPHVPESEQTRIRDMVQQQAKRMRCVAGRNKRAWAETVTRSLLAQQEQQAIEQARKVKPAVGGLIVPRDHLLLTPDEVRQLAQRATRR
jgi:hypothetical protein